MCELCSAILNIVQLGKRALVNHPPKIGVAPRATGPHGPRDEGDQMTTMMRWDPFQDLRSAQDEMAQMSPRLAHALGLHARQQGNDRAMTTAWAPALDISQATAAYPEPVAVT